MVTIPGEPCMEHGGYPPPLPSSEAEDRGGGVGVENMRFYSSIPEVGQRGHTRQCPGHMEDKRIIEHEMACLIENLSTHHSGMDNLHILPAAATSFIRGGE